MIEKVISGGQTGVDRAALDVAINLGIPCGGWCPKGRRAEDGPLPKKYPLVETPSAAYPQRTEWNVRDSDGTLILSQGKPDKGTALTISTARKLRKPCLILDIEKPAAEQVTKWVRDNGIRVLNIAGPRESSKPGIYVRSREMLAAILKQLLDEMSRNAET